MCGQPIYAVAGLGRCGSSMIMEMLVTGGMEITNCAGPFWEDGRATWLPDRTDWLDEVEGKAIKFLGMHRLTPPAGRAYRWIWLDRDKDEQVKSQHKCAHWMKRKRRDFSIPEARKESLQIIGELGGPLLMLTFEGVLEDPKGTAETIKAEFWPDLDADKAAAVVRPRSPKCLPHMEEGRRFLADPVKLAEQEARRLEGLPGTKMQCEVTNTNGQRCGFQLGHDSEHTWNMLAAPMTVYIAPVPAFKMVGNCPGCNAVVDQMVPQQMAIHIQNGGEVPGMCTRCGHPVRFRKKLLMEAGASLAQPKLALKAQPNKRLQVVKR